MLYHTFLSAVRQQLEKRLGDGYVLTIHRIPRNNGLSLDGLSICEKGSRVAPTLYLNSCYQRFQSGTPLEQLLDELLSLYRQSLANNPFDLNLLEQAESVRPRVAYRLINAQSNRELLKTLPHIPVLDLAKVFYLDLGADERGAMTVRITSAHLAHWGMDLETLSRLADENTPRLFPARILSIGEALGELMRSGRREAGHPLYILSNQNGISGAACMLYTDILKDFADRMKANLVAVSYTHLLSIIFVDVKHFSPSFPLNFPQAALIPPFLTRRAPRVPPLCRPVSPRRAHRPGAGAAGERDLYHHPEKRQVRQGLPGHLRQPLSPGKLDRD